MFEAPVIAIVGPTGTGKSELAQLVAERLGAEIVSADSMQVYRGMDVGTAKVSERDRRVTHHLIDVCDPGELYSAQRFQESSRAVFEDLERRGVPAVLCGGTGLYVQAALEDMRFPQGEQADNPLRERWESYARRWGAKALWEQLRLRDEESAALVHPNNVKRVIRALEMREQGISYARQSRDIRVLEQVVPSVRFGLFLERPELYRRVEERVERMIDDGLVDEVRGLLDRGLRASLTARAAIGYKEIVAHLDGDCTLAQAVDAIKQATRRYAKRQMTWFRRDQRIEWLDVGACLPDELADRVVRAYRAAPGSFASSPGPAAS